MPQLTDKQKKRLETLAKVIDNGDVAILERVDGLEDDIEKALNTLKNQLPDVQKALDRVEALVDGEKGESGVDGKDGSDGEKGDKGDKGDRGERGQDGKDGRNGTDGVDGIDGKDGRDGVDGKDGFIDEATIAYLEDKIDNIPKASLPSPIGIVVREIQAGSGVSIDNSNPLKPIVTATAGVNWTYYATTWSTEPTFVEAITGGDVYSYTLDGTTRYRFVPSTYDAIEDTFYSTFSSPTLSGLIVTRG